MTRRHDVSKVRVTYEAEIGLKELVCDDRHDLAVLEGLIRNVVGAKGLGGLDSGLEGGRVANLVLVVFNDAAAETVVLVEVLVVRVVYLQGINDGAKLIIEVSEGLGRLVGQLSVNSDREGLLVVASLAIPVLEEAVEDGRVKGRL